MTRLVKIARRLKANAVSFKKGGKPIVVFGLRRGGSTMLADAIAANKGVWFSNEPYAVLSAHPAYRLKKKLLPEAKHSHFFNLESDALEQFSDYTFGLLEARNRELGACRRTKFFLRADRVCLKVLNAPWMIDWFCKETDAQIVTIIRHPAAQALSVIRQGWDFPLEAYAARIRSLSGAFSGPQMSFIEETAMSDDLWAKALVDWVVTSHPLRKEGGSLVVRTRYEDIVSDPSKVVDEVLADRFCLSDIGAMMAALRMPSGSSKMSEDDTNKAILEGDTRLLIEGWEGKIDERMSRILYKILDIFEVEEYQT